MSATISSCGAASQWFWALVLLEKLCDQKVRLSQVPFNAAMSACERAGEWQQALLMMSALNLYRLRPSSTTCNTVISCLGNAGLWQQALGFLFQQRFRVDRISLNSAISASEKAGEWQQAMKLLEEFGSFQLSPDILTYNGIISACEKASQWQLALKVLWTVPTALRPTIITYNAAVSALEKGEQWQMALWLLNELLKKKFAPTHITYAAAISACEKSGEWERALILLNDTYCLGLQTNIVVYNAAISACEKGGQWQQAWLLLRQLRQHGVLSGNAAGFFSIHNWHQLTKVWVRAPKRRILCFMLFSHVVFTCTVIYFNTQTSLKVDLFYHLWWLSTAFWVPPKRATNGAWPLGSCISWAPAVTNWTTSPWAPQSVPVKRQPNGPWRCGFFRCVPPVVTVLTWWLGMGPWVLVKNLDNGRCGGSLWIFLVVILFLLGVSSKFIYWTLTNLSCRPRRLWVSLKTWRSRKSFRPASATMQPSAHVAGLKNGRWPCFYWQMPLIT